MSNTTTTEQMVEELVFRCLDNQMAARIHEAKAALKQRIEDMELMLWAQVDERYRVQKTVRSGSWVWHWWDGWNLDSDGKTPEWFVPATSDLPELSPELRERLEQERKEQ